MSREIKFRAWNTESPESGMSPTQTLLGWFGVYSRMGTHERDETCVWMQYTGLKDKNSIEIYEGDIVKQTNPTLPQFKDTVLAVEWINNGNVDAAFNIQNGDAFEVIGNIYENHELLD